MRKRVERAAQHELNGPGEVDPINKGNYITSDQAFVEARARLAVTRIFDSLMAAEVRHG